ncbi:hypothetical protein QC763_403925 [Podospora pseudopauciseta]|uniref:Uncharacterized protein n=1 Tax=Podospora pseudopauciseta TaxID=2093780 RepID=A0ABR0HCT4_9PEZI|nr:hypothetical protein QC763_403925 [Podospora pseudopauciseta]
MRVAQRPHRGQVPPAATVVAAAATNPRFEHDKDGKVSYIGKKALRGIYHNCIKKSAVMKEIFSQQFIRPAKVWTKTVVGVGVKRDHRRNPMYNWQPHADCEAALAHSRGDIAPEPCDRCREGQGRFAECVVMPGKFKGACTNCRWAAKDSWVFFPKAVVGNGSLRC